MIDFTQFSLHVKSLVLRGGLLGVWLLIASGCSQPTPPYRVISDELRALSVTPNPGAMVCAACHSEIVNEWLGSQHAHANRLLSDALDRDAFDPPETLYHGDFVTTMARIRRDEYTFTVSFSNQPPETFHPEAVIAITPLRQYLIPSPGGRLQVMDVSYDPRSNEWFNAFGDDNRQPHEWGFWKNRSMTWNVQCAFCHTTGFEKNYDIPTDSYSSTWKAMGVSCAQCHNVREHPAPGVPTEPHECPLLEPYQMGDGVAQFIADIPIPLAIENCASCHARREELFGTFKPGDQFNDHFRLALPNLPGVFEADGQVLDEDFEYSSFLLSRMGHMGVTCLDCHNPHSGKLLQVPDFNALCMRCHSPPGYNNARPINPVDHTFHPPGLPGSACIDCHMPHHTYMVNDPRRDHGFTSPDPQLTIEHGIPNACTMCHDDQTPEWATKWTEQWYGDRMKRRARDRARVVARVYEGDRTVGDALLAMAQTEEISAWRATLDSLLGAWSDQPTVVAYLQSELTNASPLVRSMAIISLADNEEAAPAILALRQDKFALVRLDAAWATLRASPPSGASIQELTAYLRNISDQPAGALRQAHFSLTQGNLNDAETWAGKALDWDHSPVPAYALGRIQHMQGNIRGALTNIADAAVADIQNAEYSFSLALLYAETGQTDAALPWFQETVRRDPAFGRGWYNLGLAYAQMERLSDAVNALTKAEQTTPGSPDPPYALATVYARQGALDLARSAAERALEALPTYRPAQQLLLNLNRF